MEVHPIDTAPKDRVILAWCVHNADPYHEADGKRLTPYASEVEGLGHVMDGWHLIRWGADYDEYDHATGDRYTVRGCWYSVTGHHEVCTPANPILWSELPLPRMRMTRMPISREEAIKIAQHHINAAPEEAPNREEAWETGNHDDSFDCGYDAKAYNDRKDWEAILQYLKANL